MTKPKLYALLIGINNYPPGLRTLSGCHNDVCRIQTYLTEQADYFELAIAPPLLDAAATKAKIVNSFRQHFKAAQADDTVLFYFAGHGSREAADPLLWPQEYDKKLEGLVCYNPEPWDGVDKNDLIGPNVLLVDKELRYLIWELQQSHPEGQGPHVVILADCCHSGDNTRNSLNLDALGIRQVEFTARQRAVKDFIFPAEWLQQKNGGIDGTAEDYLEGAHVQMGACQPHQLAKETLLGQEQQPSGVFTYYLLAFLRQNQGNLSYYELRYHLKVFTRFRYEQVPQVYIPAAHQAWYYRGFLNRPIQGGKPWVARTYYDELKGWILNKGGLDCISRRTRISVQVDAQQSIEAQLSEVHPDLSRLGFSAQEQAKLDPQQSYSCQIEGLRGAPLNLVIHNAAEQAAPLVENLQNHLLDQVKGLNVVADAREGVYTLHLMQGEYRISTGHDPFRPLVRPIALQQPGALATLSQYLRQISQWEYVKNLQSEQAEQAVFTEGWPLEISISMLDKDGQFYSQIKDREEGVVLPLVEQNGKWTGRVRISIRNQYDEAWWVCPLYLDTDFSVRLLLKTPVVRIEPRSELLVRETNISLKPHFYDYNWPADESMIKVLVSTRDNLDILPLLLEQGLPLPTTLNVKRDTGDFMRLDREEDLTQSDGWVAQTLTLQIPNPAHNQISEEQLAAMRKHAVLKDYVEAIWERGEE